MRLILCCLALSCAPATSSAPLTHQAYVWQRVWTPAVRDAVRRHDLDGLVVLTAEVSWADDKPVIDRIVTPNGGAALAVRVAVPPANVDVSRAIGPLLRELSAAHPRAEIQLDMDLPTRRLPQYTRWIHALRDATSSPLVITALPTWLDSSDFASLVRATDGFVLQVHWFDPSEPLGPLLQANAADSVRRAAALGVPFRVALPAYGHEVWLKDGVLVGLTSEGDTRPSNGATPRVVLADPVAVSKLLAPWTTAHPATLTGVVWFRLPTAQDRLAWSPATLAAVRHGQPLIARHKATFEARPGRPDELCVQSTGTLPWTPGAISLPRATMAGGRQGWRWSPARLSMIPPAHALPFRPGERRCVGWVRRATTMGSGR